MNDMMAPMLEACPSFQETWEQSVKEWKEEAQPPPLYRALAELARHLIGMLERQETSSFPEVFAVVEQWVVQGDRRVKAAAVVGLLEDIQNMSLHSKTEPEQFRPFLGPVSEGSWDELYRFWGEGSC